jgi:hypothetical protein
VSDPLVLDDYGLAAMAAAAIEKGVLSLDEMTLDEWQLALAFLDGSMQRTPETPPGCAYSAEEMAVRTG